MADDKKTFMEESQEYADKYRAAIGEGYVAFIDVSTELIARGIKTKDQVIADAKQFGLDVKDAAIDKALQVKGVVLDATGKVVQAGKDAKAWVDGKVEEGKAAVVAGKDAVVQGYRDTRDAVRGGIEAAGQWVEDKAETAAIGAMLAADKVRGKVEDVILDAGIAVEDAKAWVGDKAETVAIEAMLAADKVKDGARTAAAMGMGAVLLGKEVVIKGAKSIGEKGQEIGRAANGVKEQAVEKAQGLWGRVKQKAKAGKDAVVQGYNDTRDSVRDGIDAAGQWVEARVEDGRNVVKAGKDAVVQGYNDTRDAVKNARTEISVRTDLGISSLQEGFASFFSGLGNKLAAQAVSRKERAEQTRNARSAEKNAVDKAGQDKDAEEK